MIYASTLSHRGLIKVSGPDRISFLQGLVTNDVSKISQDKAIYTWLLTPQGKYLYDLMLMQEGEDWYMEVDQTRTQELVNRLMPYVLRSKVSFEILPDHRVMALWTSSNDENHLANTLKLSPELGRAKSTSTGSIFLDPRYLKMGARLFVKVDSSDFMTQIPEVEMASEEDYRYHRLSLGIPESSEELITDKSIPLECGMDELNAIDWEKGCYVGQELTARTRYRGLVRKRLIPFILSGPVGLDDPLKDTNQEDGKEVGKWYALSHDRGLALTRLENLKGPLFSNGVSIIPHFPEWMKLPQEPSSE